MLAPTCRSLLRPWGWNFTARCSIPPDGDERVCAHTQTQAHAYAFTRGRIPHTDTSLHTGQMHTSTRVHAHFSCRWLAWAAWPVPPTAGVTSPGPRFRPSSYTGEVRRDLRAASASQPGTWLLLFPRKPRWDRSLGGVLGPALSLPDAVIVGSR